MIIYNWEADTLLLVWLYTYRKTEIRDSVTSICLRWQQLGIKFSAVIY